METLFVLSMMIACISWTVAKTKVFHSFREFFNRPITQRIHYFLSCPYCLAHYFSIIPAIYVSFQSIFVLYFLPIWVSGIVAALIMVWMAAFQMSIMAILWRVAKF